MKKSFDEKLTSKIRDTFDNMEVPYNPDDWKKLEKKRSEKKTKGIVWLPLLAKVASIAVFLCATLYFISETQFYTEQKNYIVNNAKCNKKEFPPYVRGLNFDVYSNYLLSSLFL